jgi:hypothetical protein
MTVAEFTFPRVQALPEIDRASLRIDGQERVGYEFGLDKPRPFLFPIVGGSGAPLTRMGHPNPVGHEHHKSVWFGHQKVAGTNFWEERPGSDVRVRHLRVLLYQDGPDWGGLVAEIDWRVGDRSVMRQQLIVAIEPTADGGFALDLQSRFESPGGPVELGRSNFGFLGVRVAKTISEQFGGGRLTADDGATGEPAIFGKTHRWVDYSGPSAPGKVEGICYMDHPENPHHPSPWHVRQDGWMVAAFNLAEPYGVARDHPLDLRYRLLIHDGPADRARLDAAWQSFAKLPRYTIAPIRGQNIPALHRGPAPG